MNRNENRTTGRILTAIWLLTAIVTVIVLIVYYGKLNGIYDRLNSEKAALAAAVQQKEAEELNARSLAEAEAEAAKMQTAEADSGAAPVQQEEELPANEEVQERVLDPLKPMVALTFDDGPSIYTERIIETLNKYNANATFFMVGYNVDMYPERVKMVYDAGFEIGNHTLNHARFTSCSDVELENEVFGNERRINELVDVGELIVRPPYGSVNDSVKKAVDRPLICWSVDSRDWESRDAAAIFEECKKNTQDGYVVLMHDLYECTADAIEMVIPWLVDQGYQLCSVSEMYEARGEELLGGHVYHNTSPAP